MIEHDHDSDIFCNNLQYWHRLFFVDSIHSFRIHSHLTYIHSITCHSPTDSQTVIIPLSKL